MPYDVIIIGDLNFRVDIKYNVQTRRFCSILDSDGWTQHVNTTHKGGHTLDLAISRESSPIIVGTPSVFDPCLSSNKGKSFGDHLAVQFNFNMDKSDCIQRNIRYRKYRGINNKEFIEDLQSSQHLINCEGSVDELVEAYDKACSFVFKNHHVETRNSLETEIC